MIRPEGIIVPLVTPMRGDGSVDICAIEPQVERMIDNGVDGIFAFGTNGEGFILSYEEKREVLAAIVSAVAGRVPVFAGTGVNILTINQNIPANGCAVVTITAETSALSRTLEEMLEAAAASPGVIKCEILAG